MRFNKTMKMTTLKNNPELYKKTIELIEKEFQYPKDNTFEVDFFPLVSPENHHNCHLLLEGPEVIGHIGVREVKILDLPALFIGGIAIKGAHQGKGFFSKFFTEVLRQYSNYAFYLLWSEKHTLYEKFHFIPAIKLYEYEKISSNIKFNFHKTSLKEFFKMDLSLIKTRYLAPERSEESIGPLSLINSTDVYFKEKDGKVSDYFFVNKGADLKGIIHESYFSNSESFEEALSQFECWSPLLYENHSSQEVASCLMKIGNHELFKKFIELYTKSQIKILAINNDTIHFQFKEETLNLNSTEFVQGILGPNEFEEIKELKLPALFIPGIESI